MLAGRQAEIRAARDRKLKEARHQRQLRREAASLLAHSSNASTMTSPGETEAGSADATMLRDNLVELIEPMPNSAGADPLARYIQTPVHASDDRLPCLKNPRPEGAESSLTENVTSPFQAEPAQDRYCIVVSGFSNRPSGPVDV